jgi:hypothetical protein
VTDGPVVQVIGDEIFVTWSGLLNVQFGHFMDGRWGLQAEVSVQGSNLGELAWGQLLLVSSESRGKLAKKIDPSVAPLFDQACREAVRAFRRPPAWQPLRPVRRPETAHAWIWSDWIPAGETTVFYGDGDSGKSLLALSVALAALTGLPLAGTWPIAKLESVLYVDYESTVDEHAHRLALLSQSLEVPRLEGLHYLRATRPLHEMAAVLRAQQQRTHAGLVIVDSLGAACAGEPESAQAAIAALNTLFALGPACSRLVLAHVSKLDAAQSGPRRAYGSVYVRNLPRANVEVRRDPLESHGLAVTLRVEKNNVLHRKPAPIGLKLEATDEAMTWERTKVQRGGLTRTEILARLPAAADDAISTATLAKDLNVDLKTISKQLERMADDGLVKRVVLGGRGKGQPTTWIRIDTKRDTEDDSSATSF